MNLSRMHALAVVLCALGVALLSGLHANGFMRTLNVEPAPALVDLSRGEADIHPVEPVERRLTLILVDGLREDYADQLGLDVTTGARCVLSTPWPSYSRPAYVALSTGVPPSYSGVRVNAHRGSTPLESIYQIARTHGFSVIGVTEGLDWWKALFPSVWTELSTEKSAFDIQSKRIFRAKRQLTLIHILKVDTAGHEHGADSEAYRQAIISAGALIRARLAAMNPATDTVIVTSDHGHLDRGGHGGAEAIVTTVPLFAFGSGIQGNTRNPCQGKLIDIAATVSALLKLPLPRQSFGQPLTKILTDEDSIRPRLKAQQARLKAVIDALHRDGYVVQKEPDPLDLLRYLALWLFGMSLFAWQTPASREKWRIILSGAFYPGLAILAYMVFEPAFSFSAVWDKGPWLGRMALGFAGVLILSEWARRRIVGRAIALSERYADLGWAVLGSTIAWARHGSLWGGEALASSQDTFALLLGDLTSCAGAGVILCAALYAGLRRAFQRDASPVA